MSFSQWDLATFLKRKRRYMSAQEIARETMTTLTSVNRKLNKIRCEKKVKKVLVGKCVCKRPVTFFRVRQ
jgi:hypothetical protein